MKKEDKLVLGTLAGVDLILSPEHYEEYKGTLNKQLEEANQEIERLQNIINKLEKYIVEEIDDAQKELNIILQGNNLDYKNECTKEFNCIKNALDMLLDKLKELKDSAD